MEWAAACERYRVEFLGQPADAVSSVAFVAATVGILLARRHGGTRRDMPVRDGQTVIFAVLVAGVGVGSFVQHGPHPDWQAYPHDLLLAGVLMFVAVDGGSDLTGRDLSPSWWLAPTVALVPAVAAGAAASTMVQAAMAATAIGVNLVRAWRRPAVRRTLIAALVTVSAGAAIGALTDRTSLCQADRFVQGHALWHVLAAVALWRLAAAIGVRHRSPSAAATPIAVA